VPAIHVDGSASPHERVGKLATVERGGAAVRLVVEVADERRRTWVLTLAE
jgi:hypothetical protein